MLKHRSHDKLFNLVLIETWNVCNRKCWFCKFGQPRLNEAKIKMADGTIDTILNDLSSFDYAGRVSWVGINEPLLDGRLVDMISKTRLMLPQCFQSTITNGDKLTERLYRDLVSAGLNSMAISVYDDDSMERILRLDLPGVKLWDKRQYMVPLDAVNMIDFTNRAGQLRVPVAEPSVLNLPCYKTHTGISVLPNGDIPLCSDDMYGDVVMGSVIDRSLVDVWFGDKFERYRSGLSRSRIGLTLCESCTNKGGPHEVRFP